MANHEHSGMEDRSSAGDRPQSLPRLLLRELRLHQWVKNVLVFLPFILAHEWDITGKWISAVYAFFSFSLVASSVYVVNDIWDREADRRHPTKRYRPIASGALSLRVAWITVPIVLLGGLSLGWFLISRNSPAFCCSTGWLTAAIPST
ncbi:MAG: UbiA family prenyltransferase [Balneolaceae bacterium]|nr:UbiA family prenyltransferase [Balneolaceae bacterium]